jgi:hypothetical protein
MRAEWQDIGPQQAIKIYFESLGLRCQLRQRGSRYYATVTRIDTFATWDSQWLQRYTGIVQKFYPNAYCTSGGADRATFCLGTVFDMIKNAR